MTTATKWLYDLWYLGQPIYQTISDKPLSRQDVITSALSWLDRVPLCDRPQENPIDRMHKILCSELRVYEIK